jgi:negative regulator of sigma E activity
MNEGIRMQVSAFVDGELPDNEADLLLRRMSQDVELRKEVAEYLAIGRLTRGEAGLAGADRLHERIAAAIDDRPADDGNSAGATITTASRAIRPLAGIAIAASVALVAVFTLQQTTGIDELPVDEPLPLANEVVPNIDAQQERQRQYFLNHAESSSQLGASGMISRVVTLRFSEDVTPQVDVDESDELGDDDDESSEMTTQP